MPGSSTQTSGRQRASDPRPARTRAALLQAIAELGAEGSAISVASITSRAGVSRSSFYAQYRDIGDLALQLMRELFTEIRETDQALRASSDPASATRATLRLLLEELHERRTLYRSVWGAGLTVDAGRSIQTIFAEGARDTIGRVAPSGVDVDFAAGFVAAGVSGALHDWLLAEDPPAAERVIAQVLRMLPDWLAGSGDG